MSFDAAPECYCRRASRLKYQHAIHSFSTLLRVLLGHHLLIYHHYLVLFLIFDESFTLRGDYGLHFRKTRRWCFLRASSLPRTVLSSLVEVNISRRKSFNTSRHGYTVIFTPEARHADGRRRCVTISRRVRYLMGWAMLLARA